MSNFEVIVPVVNFELMKLLVESIYANTLLPKKIILIDNSKRPAGDIFKFVPFNNHTVKGVYYSKTGLVNESLNLGIDHVSKDCDFVTFLNDDVILSDCFFQRNLELFKNKDCGVACPFTITSIDEMKNGKAEPKMLRKREGWAFTIRKTLLDGIPPIPCERIATFHGDDWIWYHTVPKGNFWFKDIGNVIYHQVGASVDRLGFKKHKRKERNAFIEIAKEKGWTA